MEAADVEITVGGSLRDDLQAFRDAWKRTEAGEHVEARRVLALPSWSAMASVLTPERVRLLRHLARHAEPSVSALGRSLHRPWRRIHEDVVALEKAGLIDRSAGDVRATATRIRAEVDLLATTG